MGPMTVPQKRMALLFAATAALWVFRADLRIGALEIPGWSRLFMGADASDPVWYARHKNDISDATVATLLGILAFVIPSGWREGQGGGAQSALKDDGDRRFLMDWRTASRLPWDVLLLLGGGFCLAHAFKVSGLDAVLGGADEERPEGANDDADDAASSRDATPTDPSFPSHPRRRCVWRRSRRCPRSPWTRRTIRTPR